MKIGDTVQLKSKQGPLLCVSAAHTLPGDPVDLVYCCYWHSSKQEFIYVLVHKYMLMIVDPESSEEVDPNWN
jgi:hypothetical protein